MSDQTAETQATPSEAGGDSIFKVLLPYLVGTAFLSAMLVLGVVKLTGISGKSGGPVNAVVFDVIKLSNAQRAVASAFIKQGGDSSAENATLLLDVSKRTRQSIEKIAGKNTLVLVKQGVVSPALPDITDDVLKDLGLPVTVPTQDTMGYLTDFAPSYLSMVQQPRKRASAGPVSSGNASVLP